MKTYMVHSVRYTPGPYGEVARTTSRRSVSADELKHIARNFSAVTSRPGASAVCFDMNRNLIFQVSGYNNNRGMFADVVPLEELAPFLTA